MRVMWCEDNIDSSTRETQPSAAKLNQMRKKQLFVTEDDDVNNGLCKYSNAAEARGVGTYCTTTLASEGSRGWWDTDSEIIRAMYSRALHTSRCKNSSLG